jgi:ABC-type transport system involved in cytochrome c biogenesis ATPase subunit
VLLDEPLTSLDGDGATLLLNAVQQLLGRNGVVLWCSPSEENLAINFNARWVIDRGRLTPA